MSSASSASGVFRRPFDRDRVAKWFIDTLAITTSPWGALFPWRESEERAQRGYVILGLVPRNEELVLSIRVADLTTMLGELRMRGVDASSRYDDEHGLFAIIRSPTSQKIELWEARDAGGTSPGVFAATG